MGGGVNWGEDEMDWGEGVGFWVGVLAGGGVGEA